MVKPCSFSEHLSIFVADIACVPKSKLPHAWWYNVFIRFRVIVSLRARDGRTTASAQPLNRLAGGTCGRLLPYLSSMTYALRNWCAVDWWGNRDRDECCGSRMDVRWSCDGKSCLEADIHSAFALEGPALVHWHIIHFPCLPPYSLKQPVLKYLHSLLWFYSKWFSIWKRWSNVLCWEYFLDTRAILGMNFHMQTLVCCTIFTHEFKQISTIYWWNMNSWRLLGPWRIITEYM